jgi:hypothetical protein
LNQPPAPAPLNRRRVYSYLRVLYWCFVEPRTMYAYRHHYGQADLQYIGIWLTPLFLWIPLLIPAISMLFGLVDLNPTVSTIFLLSFSSGVWYLYARADLSGALLGILFFHVHLIDKSAVDVNLGVGLLAQFALIAAYSTAVVVGNATVNPGSPISVFIVVLAGVGTWVAWHVGGAGFATGLLLGAFFSAVWAPFVMETGWHLRHIYREPQRTSFMPMVAALITAASVGALVWLFWLGGWRVWSAR